MATILVVEDDKDIRDLIAILLKNNGYVVVEAQNGEKALSMCLDNIDLVLLDVMMPIKDGFATCKELREITKIPIIFLTAKGQEYDKIIGFSAGGDDYVVKPFVPSELLARVSASLRRYLEYGSGEVADTIIHIGALIICEGSCKVTVNDEEKSLTATEYNILHLLCKTRGKVFSAQNIYESIWQEPYFYNANNTVMVHIRKLREKIEEDPKNPKYIKTIWGMGYKIEA